MNYAFARAMGVFGLVAVGLMVLSLPLLLALLPRVDELTYLSHGLRQVDGAVIYRDFFEFTTPMSSWLAALIFKVGGPTLLAARLAQGAVVGVTGGLMYRAARIMGANRPMALLTGGLLVLCLFRAFPGFSHHWIMLPFVWGGLLCGMKGLGAGRRRWWVAAGICAGFGFLTMQTDGVGLFAGLSVGMAIATLLQGGSLRQVVIRFAALVAGALVPAMFAIAYLAWHGALLAAYEHVWVWPMKFYRQAGGINDLSYLMDLSRHNLVSTASQANPTYWYGKLFHVATMYLLPPAAAVGALAWGVGVVWRRWSTGRPLEEREGAIGLVAVAAVVFMALATRGRADYTHAAFYATPAVVLACVWASTMLERLKAPDMIAFRLLPAAALFSFALTGAMLVAAEIRHSGPLPTTVDYIDQRMKSGSANQYLKTHAKPGDRIVSLPAGGYHYFFSLPPASRFTLLLTPDYGYNSVDDLVQVGREIQAQKPAFVLLARPFIDKPGRNHLDSGLVGYERVSGQFATPGLGPTQIYRRVMSAETKP